MIKPKYKGFYNIVRNTVSQEATVYIYGVIGGFDWDTYEYINTDSKFVNEFKELEKEFDPINIRINSPGGDIHQGTPIVNAIRASKSHTNIYVDGIAYSMAAEIAIAGDTCYMYDNSRLMFHNASTGAWGNAQELRVQADVLDSYDKSLAPLIANKLNISEEEALGKYLNFKDNYFTAAQAKDEGFANTVLSSSANDLPDNIDDLSPDALMKHYAKMNFSKNNTPKPNNMKKHQLPAIQAVLNMGETPFESNDEGIYLNEGQPQEIEAALIDKEAKINSLQTTVDNNATAESDRLAAAQIQATANQTIVDAVNAELELKGDDKATTLKEAIAAQTKKIQDLNGNPGAQHSGGNPADPDDDAPDHGIVDFSSPVYAPLRKN